VLLSAAPLLPAIPLITALRYFRDPFFALSHLNRFLASAARPFRVGSGAPSHWGAGVAAGSLG
jgi:hypothetical protein